MLQTKVMYVSNKCILLGKTTEMIEKCIQ